MQLQQACFSIVLRISLQSGKMHWEQFPKYESCATLLHQRGPRPSHGGANSLQPSIPSLVWFFEFYSLKPGYPSVTCIISLPLFLLSSSPQLHVARSVSQRVRPSGASGPLRLRPPPQLSKAETRHCGHAILAAVVGFRQPAFEQNTDGVTDTCEQKRGNGLVSSAAARREQWTSRWQGHSLEFMRCSSSPCPFLRAWEGATNLWNGMMWVRLVFFSPYLCKVLSDNFIPQCVLDSLCACETVAYRWISGARTVTGWLGYRLIV